MKVKTEMMNNLTVILMALWSVGNLSAQPRESLAKFEGGLGVSPVQNGAKPVNPDVTCPNVRLNVVRVLLICNAAGAWFAAGIPKSGDD